MIIEKLGSFYLGGFRGSCKKSAQTIFFYFISFNELIYLNVFENRKHIKSNFIKIEKLSKKYEKFQFDKKYDNDKETREELLEEIEEKAVELSNSIAKMFFGNVIFKLTDNQRLCAEGGAYAG
ncbi:hypothetical protein KO488_12770 [Poseidonibacter lekithochrous]|uniref:hypothetical protein n=1 Tax=Poseidonibacter TaxID=2321187 RepID=UPI001C08DBF9|nr:MULTISPECIES: hypothetical protein [Poseidonibacter]MBU3015635.1 hypothetical protein [Poseidonibacter lekithochrous]MDO6828935.1 hypothetical protein [Poseidonibacter sp. 1_MG-2023]